MRVLEWLIVGTLVGTIALGILLAAGMRCVPS